MLCDFQYYFGDKNLPKDKFLLQQIEEDDGCILYLLDCVYSNDVFSTKLEGAVTSKYIDYQLVKKIKNVSHSKKISVNQGAA